MSFLISLTAQPIHSASFGILICRSRFFLFLYRPFSEIFIFVSFIRLYVCKTLWFWNTYYREKLGKSLSVFLSYFDKSYLGYFLHYSKFSHSLVCSLWCPDSLLIFVLDITSRNFFLI